MYICERCKSIYVKVDGKFMIEADKYSDAEFSTCGECEKHIIDVDDEMVPVLIHLWDKGYKTLFSCSGHGYSFDRNESERFGLDTYIMINANNFNDEFIEDILKWDTKRISNLAEITLTTSVINNITIKCIRIGANLYNPRIAEISGCVSGYANSVVPVPIGRMAAHEYSLLCELRKEITDIVTILPRVTEDSLIDSESFEDFVAGIDYDCAYDSLWVENTLRKFPPARRDVLTFISAVNHYSENLTVDGFRTPIERLFGDGFCYYFALMLHDAFGGTIVWHKNHSHILWMDDHGVAYNIYGVFENCLPEDLVPIEEIAKDNKDMIESFKHRKLGAL